MIRAEGIVATRGGRRILDGLDLDLPPGSHTVVTGANGSGKSTLLKAVAGLMRLSAGRVLGRPPRVGHMPERFVPPAMDAARYLGRMGLIKGLTRATIEARRDELADALAVLPGLDAGTDQLSKGNLQKVGLIQAFLAPEQLVVLDEPRTGLDEQGRAALDRLIIDARSSGAAVLSVDHAAPPSGPGVAVCELHEGRLRWPQASC